MSADINHRDDDRSHKGRRHGATALSFRTARCFVTLALAILVATLAAAQPPGKLSRIGVLRPGDPLPSTAVVPQPFLERLRELGYVEGQNIAFEARHGGGSLEKGPDLAAELVRLKVDVIVVASFPFARAVKQATTTIPIVSISADPVGTGLAASVARPGGNLTGFSYMTPELSGKRLELLKETVPGLSRVAILWNPDNLHEPPAVKQLERAAQALAVELQSVEVRTPSELQAAFTAAGRARADALIVFENPLHVSHRNVIAELATKSRLPTMFEIRSFVEAGGLIAYGPRIVDMWRLAATYVDRILKGAKPADLPIEQPTKFELVINAKTAAALGLTIPQSVLLRADHVIQ
jgi:putative ABC transport system substrate-binding protein